MQRTVITEDDLGGPAQPPAQPPRRGGLTVIVSAIGVALVTGLVAGHWVLPARAADTDAGPALAAAQADLHELQREVDRQRLAASQARVTARTARKRGYHAGLAEGRAQRIVCAPPQASPTPRPSAPAPRPQAPNSPVPAPVRPREPGPPGAGPSSQADALSNDFVG